MSKTAPRRPIARHSLAALGLILTLIAPPALAAEEDYPFIGTWDCQTAELTFTATGYDAGMGTVDYLAVNHDGDVYTLDFQDDYSVLLQLQDDGTLIFHSTGSGDELTCHRMS